MRVGWRLLTAVVLAGPLAMSGAVPAGAAGVPGFAETVRVSVASDGSQADGDSFSPNVGGGASLVAFDSAASTLVADDHNRGSDVFLHTDDDTSAGSSPATSPTTP